MDNSKKNNHQESNPDERLREACLHWVQCLNHHGNKESYCAILLIIFDYLISNDIYELNDPFFEDILKKVISQGRRIDIITGWSTGYMKAGNIETAERVITSCVNERLFPGEDFNFRRSEVYVKIAKDLKEAIPKKSIIKILLLALKEAKEVINIGIKKCIPPMKVFPNGGISFSGSPLISNFTDSR